MLRTNDVAALLAKIAAEVYQQRDFLTELDAAIGDGDHGHNLSKGFQAVADKVLTAEHPHIGQLLKQTGMTLISTVGGASGPLYGTAFLRMGALMEGKQEVTVSDLPGLLEAAVGGIKQRGKAEQGEKTMLDALIPASQALASALAEGGSQEAALAAATAAAEEGVAFTKTIRATKGRASYLGDRSIGHQDPGATSSWLMIRTMRDFAAGR